MEIAELAAGDVTLLDVTGKMTLGEGDEILKDKIHSLSQQGRKKIILNLAGCRTSTAPASARSSGPDHHQPRGRQPEAARADEADHRPAVDHETLTVFETYDNEADAVRSFSSSAQGLTAARWCARCVLLRGPCGRFGPIARQIL